MESRKTVLMNLYMKKQWRCRCRQWTGGHSRGRKDRLRKDPGQPEPGAVASEHVELDETFKITKSHHLTFQKWKQ